jgi:glycosyltransferase involved in cell wall biosynthesis
MSGVVSAIIPVLGPQPLLLRAIDSALGNAAVSELIVVDDGSPEPLKLRSDPRLKVIRHERNKGTAAARNTGARAAVCAWLGFLDSDDIWGKEKIRKQVALLESNKSGAIGAVCAFGFQRGGRHVVCRPPENTLEFRHALSGARFGLGSTMIISRAAFLASRGYDESFARFEDWEWLLRILRSGHMLTMQDELVTISHGYRAVPSEAFDALARLPQSPALTGLPPSQRRMFQAAIALERASLQFAGSRRLAAALSYFEAARLRPAWAARAVFNRAARGSVPGT